ncbi:MAG TPA: hypothetical protein VGN52_12845 [Burkholderiales bacterium]
MYKSELSEFDVLGVNPNIPVSDAEIRRALAERKRLDLPRGSALMLIQPGALIPDEERVKDLEKYYAVGVFSGVPGGNGAAAGAGYAPALRLAAARAGRTHLMVCWGLLESGQENLATRAISWFPIVGGAVPDQAQRIRMEVALIDVASGRWETFTPPPFEDRDTSSRYGREASDQAQVAQLKQKAYGQRWRIWSSAMQTSGGRITPAIQRSQALRRSRVQLWSTRSQAARAALRASAHSAEDLVFTRS